MGREELRESEMKSYREIIWIKRTNLNESLQSHVSSFFFV